MVLRLLEPGVLREPGRAVDVQHLGVGVLHHEAALARVHRLVREGLLRGARAHPEERAVEHDREPLEPVLVAAGEVGPQPGEALGESRVVGVERGLPRQLLGEGRVDLGLVAARQQRVHAAAVLAEFDEVLGKLGGYSFSRHWFLFQYSSAVPRT